MRPRWRSDRRCDTRPGALRAVGGDRWREARPKNIREKVGRAPSPAPELGGHLRGALGGLAMSKRVSFNSFYIFNKDGTCLYYRDWKSKGKVDAKELMNQKKNMFGLLLTLKTFVNEISPVKPEGFASEPIRYFETSEYKLHYMETQSGLRFALSTNVGASGMLPVLQQMYRLFVDFVVRNPTCEQGAEVKVGRFNDELERYVKSDLKAI